MNTRATATACAIVLACCADVSRLPAQERGAASVDHQVRGLTNAARVLMIGAHPDDEDTQLITWLARGRQVETAYLSLTRGDGGQNLIGNELGEALGAIRTQELLAARRLDGGRQFFTRAYDFGFSKNADETLTHWDRDSLLADIVTVLRAFRPQVVVSVWSGTPEDGHGHHQLVGMLAREAFDASADTTRFPAWRYGQPWEAMKFYRSARQTPAAATLTMNVGEYDPVLGRAYGEVAAESRAEHRSQGQGRAQLQRGVLFDYLVRMASRVNESTPAPNERSMFDGIDTSLARFARANRAVVGAQPQAPGSVGVTLATIQTLADSARGNLDLGRPDRIVRWLAPAASLAERLRRGIPVCTLPPRTTRSGSSSEPREGVVVYAGAVPGAPCDAESMDLDATLDVLRARTATALLTAAGIVVEASAPRELLAFGDSMPVDVRVYNRGRESVTIEGMTMSGTPATVLRDITLAPDSVAHATVSVIGLPDTRPWWLGRRRPDVAGGDMFPARASPADGLTRVSYGAAAGLRPGASVPEDRRRETNVTVSVRVGDASITTSAGPIIYRSSDPVLGEQNRPVGGVPAVSLAFDGGLEWVIASKPLDRLIRLTLKSYSMAPRTMSFTVISPAGIRVDSVPASLTLEAGEVKELFLRLRGQLKPGRYDFGVVAVTEQGKYFEGLTTIEYPHIAPIRIYRSSGVYLQAVEIAIPATLSVAYVQGVGDESAKALRQLGIPVSLVQAAELPVLDLSRFTTLVVGPRAFEAHPELVAYNARVLDFAKKGGTVVVQYGQQEMTRPGLLPFPITLTSPAQRVTEEQAPVTVLDPKSRLLNTPNKLAESDWAAWVQERALYMPATIDPRWSTPIEMHDPGEAENKGALLVAPMGKGMYVYTTLSLFRQIPGGVPGGPRLFVNLLSAGLETERVTPRRIQP